MNREGERWNVPLPKPDKQKNMPPERPKTDDGNVKKEK